MTRLRLILLALLFLAPFVVLMGFGGYYLWHAGILWVWWPLLACMGLAYFLAWRWTRKRGLLPPTDIPPPEYWTERDKIAWERVDAKARSFEKVTLDQISTARHYADLAIDLATEVGTIYNPASADPFDTSRFPKCSPASNSRPPTSTAWRSKYVPGVHLIRMKDTKRAKKAYGWYKTGQDVYWAWRGALRPDLRRPSLSRVAQSALGSLIDRIQDNLILWFHTAFIHQLGRYLIELNSGRLKVGVKRYREILAQHQEPPATEPAQATDEIPAAAIGAPPAAAKPITFGVLGTGEGRQIEPRQRPARQAGRDGGPPAGSQRNALRLTLAGGQPVSLLDTSGYGERHQRRRTSPPRWKRPATPT